MNESMYVCMYTSAFSQSPKSTVTENIKAKSNVMKLCNVVLGRECEVGK